MDLLEDLWKEQGAQLKVALERMPLSHIQEELKMYLCYHAGMTLTPSEDFYQQPASFAYSDLFSKILHKLSICACN